MSIVNNPYRARRQEFASYGANNYNGPKAGAIVHAAVSAGDTLANGWVTQLDGIPGKANITDIITGNPVQAAACDWTDGADVVVADNQLDLTDLMVNENVCRKTFFHTYQVQSGSRVNSNMVTKEFEEAVIASVAAKTAEQVETLLWKGNDTLGVKGLLSNDGALDAAGLAASSLASATSQTISALSATNILGELQKVHEKASTSKPAVLTKSDVGIYLSPESYSFYLYALSTAGGQGFANAVTNQGFNQVNYLGVPVYRCPGMFNDAIVLAEKSKLIVGTNAATDLTEVKFIPTYQYDGSDNVRVVIRFGLDTVAPIQGDVILGKTF